MAQDGTHTGSSARKGGWLDWIERHPKVVGAACVLVVLAGVWFALEAAGNARLRRAMAAIRAKGEPLTVEDLRKRVLVLPDEKNMALGLQELGTRIQQSSSSQPANGWMQRLPIAGNAIAPPVGVRYSEVLVEDGRRFVALNAVPIEGIVRATRMEAGVYPIQWTTPAVMVLLPNLSAHREVVKSLILAATLAAHDGRADECTRQLTAAAATDRTIRHSPFLISMLVRVACQSLICDTMLRSVALTTFTDDELRMLDGAIGAFGGGQSLHDAMIAERATTLDTIVWAYGKGSIGAIAPGVGPSSGILKLVPGMRGADSANFLEQMTRICDAAGKRPREAMADMGIIEADSGNMPFYALITKMMTPSVSRAFAVSFRSEAVVRATRAALAAERYRLKHEAWPGTIDLVSPEFVPADAIVDPFSGKPLVYRRDADGIRIYSVGEDGVDDGGIMDREQTRGMRVAFDPGVYLPNPELRNRAATTKGTRDDDQSKP